MRIEQPAAQAGDETYRPRPLFIFDLDGTVALIEHRRAMLEDKTNGHRWRNFYAACDLDLPNTPVIDTLWMLHTSGAEIWIWSGRSDEVADKTWSWLKQHLSRGLVLPFELLRMRKENDYTPDNVLKEKWLLGMAERDRQRLVACFDDRDRVVALYRSHGVCCYQVAPGNF